jgi:hypothetical protein
MAIYKPRFYTFEKMLKVEEFFPIGECEAGWYFYEESEGAPIGPFPSYKDTMIGIDLQIALNYKK